MEKGLVQQQPVHGFALQQLHEYLLVAHPATEVYAQVMAEKQRFYDAYKEKVAIKTLPHITVADFLAHEEMEDTIIRYLHRIIGTQKSFAVTLNNYSGFPPHTIYLRVQHHEPFKQLAASLATINQYVRSNGMPQAHLITHPHVSIARRLPQQVYEKAMFEYSQRSFHASFEVSELLLLKRKGQFDKCKEISVFRFL